MIKRFLILLFVWAFIASIIYLGAAFTFWDWNWFEMAGPNTRAALYMVFCSISVPSALIVYT